MSPKSRLIETILAQLKDELGALTASAKAAHEAATHEESKAEDAHDTRALEAGYLASAQSARIEMLQKMITSFQVSDFRDYKDTDRIAVGAWVTLHSEGKDFQYLLTNSGGGTSVVFQGQTVQVITPQAPLGEALLGRRVGDAIEVERPGQSREYEITAIA